MNAVASDPAMALAIAEKVKIFVRETVAGYQAILAAEPTDRLKIWYASYGKRRARQASCDRKRVCRFHNTLCRLRQSRSAWHRDAPGGGGSIQK